MTSSGARGGPSGSWPVARAAAGPVVSGRIPPLALSWSQRPETGCSLRSLPSGEATVLVASDDAAAGGLRGLGGTGKTHLAAALAREQLEHHSADLIVWVTATGRDAVIGGYAQARRDAGAHVPGEGPEQAAAQFRDWLAKTDRPWLVVLDDLSDPAAVEGLWPRGAAGRTLITTELSDIGGFPGSRVATVGALTHREALWYISDRLGADHDQRMGAPDLVAELELLPIALGQAAAVMAETGMDCHRYRALVAGRRAQPPSSPDGRYAVTAAATWSLSTELADSLAPAGLAGRALALISMLGPHGIPGALLTSQAACAYITGSGAMASADESQTRAAVFNLARAGLVSIDAADAARTVLAHSLVQAIARQNLPAAERDQAARAAADALLQVWAGQEIPEEVAQSLRDCTARLRQASGSVLWAPQCHPVLLQAGQSLEAGGLSGPAAAYWQGMLGISQRQLGPAHADTVRFRDLLGAAFEASGHLDEAITTYRHVVTDLENTLGARHPATLADRANLARAYRAAGRSRDAIDLAKQTVIDCEQALGADHPDTLAARGSLADGYVVAGRFKDAIGERQRALAAWERVQGPDHVETIAARTGLAGAYRSAGKHKDAIKNYQRAVADAERVQGSGHLDTIGARRELALAYMMAGRMAYSVEQYERALADCERALGPDHPLTREIDEDLEAAAVQGIHRSGIDLRTPRSAPG